MLSHQMTIKTLPLGANLYVKNLKPQDPHTTFAELYSLFSKYGKIYSVKLHVAGDGNSKEFAYLQFSTKEAAEEAKKDLHKTVLGGAILEVENYWKQYVKPVAGDLNNLFIKGFPGDTSEDELLEEFKHFGLVKNISIVPGKGFGFISFENST